MSPIRLAVDYGTSHTVAAVDSPDGGGRLLLFDGSPLLPSAVYGRADGQTLTGKDALGAARLEPGRFEPNPKRRVSDGTVLLGEQDWPVAALIASTLTVVTREAGRVAGAPIGELVMTCPVSWGRARRSVLTEAAAIAGLPEPVFVTEPVAAGAFYVDLEKQRIRPGQALVVYDLGGGTFDVSVVRYLDSVSEPLAHKGIDDFGGVDLDELIVRMVRQTLEDTDPDVWRRLNAPRTVTERRALQSLWTDARAAKETLSRHSSAGLPVPLTERDVVIGREEFDRLAVNALRRTVDLTMETIGEAGVARTDVAGIFLVGGSSRVPQVATLLHRAAGVAPMVHEQPETVVVRGALLASVAAKVPVASVHPVPVASVPPAPMEPVSLPPVPAQYLAPQAIPVPPAPAQPTPVAVRPFPQPDPPVAPVEGQTQVPEPLDRSGTAVAWITGLVVLIVAVIVVLNAIG